MDSDHRGPLAGRTVVELAGIGPAPFACMMLAELGAEVIRIDRPVRGGGPAASPGTDLLNRGKRSVILDLKRSDGVEAVLAIAERADVLVEGYRPGVAERLGVGPEQVWARNPGLVYGRMTGWGQDGPLASSAGHDIGYIALTGALHAIGDAGGPPQVPLNLVGDFGGGSTYLVVGVLAALLEAAGTGRGQVVDAAIVDGAAHLLSVVHALLNAGRWADRRGVNLLDGGAPYYAVYETADRRHVAVGAIEPPFYAELLAGLALDRSQADPAAQDDRADWPRLRQVLARRFATRTMAEWAAVFAGTDACVAPVLSVREAASHPHLAARGSVVDDAGLIQAGPAPRLSAHPDRGRRVAPERGADTRAVLAWAGLDPDVLFAGGAAG